GNLLAISSPRNKEFQIVEANVKMCNTHQKPRRLLNRPRIERLPRADMANQKKYARSVENAFASISCANDSESDVLPPLTGWNSAVAIGRTAIARIKPEATTSNHLAGTVSRAGRIDRWGLYVVVRIKSILAPLQHIAVHIV